MVVAGSSQERELLGERQAGALGGCRELQGMEVPEQWLLRESKGRLRS